MPSQPERPATEALLVRRVVYGEADLVVTLFTEQDGLIAALARGARRSSRRFPALEPVHRLRVKLQPRAGGLWRLVDAVMTQPRPHLVADLARLEAAGQALRWVRAACSPTSREPAIWRETEALLTDLDVDEGAVVPSARLASFGLRLLAMVGWGIELDRCVRCGKPCEASASACVDPALGGLVCRACGGARMVLRAELLGRLRRARAGDVTALDDGEAARTLELIDALLQAHAAA
jgi:DNA repair protein RecO (recombination protein O)